MFCQHTVFQERKHLIRMVLTLLLFKLDMSVLVTQHIPEQNKQSEYWTNWTLICDVCIICNNMCAIFYSSIEYLLSTPVSEYLICKMATTLSQISLVHRLGTFKNFSYFSRTIFLDIYKFYGCN